MTFTRLDDYEQAMIDRESHWRALRENAKRLRNWPTACDSWQIAVKTSMQRHLYLWRAAFDATETQTMKDAA